MKVENLFLLKTDDEEEIESVSQLSIEGKRRMKVKDIDQCVRTSITLSFVTANVYSDVNPLQPCLQRHRLSTILPTQFDGISH